MTCPLKSSPICPRRVITYPINQKAGIRDKPRSHNSFFSPYIIQRGKKNHYAESSAYNRTAQRDNEALCLYLCIYLSLAIRINNGERGSSDRRRCHRILALASRNLYILLGGMRAHPPSDLKGGGRENTIMHNYVLFSGCGF
ncbi:hypothetical protein CEXT_810651 [Caerostris extrusa]|uniref:Uncharacterized protein n=1 Tax=Caerostris extrusa TaxID=172846 RepID=A0AAV4QNV8_CAEEX|nr:hypothetical protein CEXT_810651 [Caerostris extrusa]